MATHKPSECSLNWGTSAWEPFEHTLARQSLQWLGHVARMPKELFPKRALFGFWKDHPTKTHPTWRQGQWLKHLLAQVGISEMGWFRLAQDKEAWNQAIFRVFPRQVSDTGPCYLTDGGCQQANHRVRISDITGPPRNDRDI